MRTVRLIGYILLVVSNGCQYLKEEPALFEQLPSSQTNIRFANNLTETDEFNALTFDYIYNGSGVAVGDINNDGLIDIFFGGNQVSSRLYLNQGNFKFTDITEKAGVITSQWVTGVSIVDINQDGYQDIYVCVAGKTLPNKMANRLYINNKNNTFTEAAQQYGLDDTGYTTQATFLDYDRDGDLDVYLLTNALENFNRNTARPKTRQNDGRSVDRLYRNNGNNTFSNVSKVAGIVLEGYGLGVGISDFNQDGYPDIYVANDFITNDVLYINNGNGTFTNQIRQYLKHQSHNSMGTDIADINNDGNMDIMVLDMLPEDNRHQKTMLGSINYDRFKMNLEVGYEPQYVRNSLQLNNGNGTFSEIGRLAGVSNTDWSWGPLLADFDNDGYRDIFISNGYRKDITDLDFVTYNQESSVFGTEEAKRKEVLERLKKLPGTKLHNYIYRNNRNLTFADKSKAWGLGEPSYSNGAAYADFDNDGDQDLIISNIDAEAFVYRNQSREKLNHHYLQLKLAGTAPNRQALGARLKITTARGPQYYEHYPVKGFKSMQDNTVHFGLGADTLIKSLEIVWPSGEKQILKNLKCDQVLTLQQTQANLKYTPSLAVPKTYFKEVSKQLGVRFKAADEDYVDFKIQPALPHKFSQSGPGIAVGDADGNGLEDFYVGGSRNYTGNLFMQQPGGKFTPRPLTASPATSDETGVLFFDADQDGDLDLYAVGGGSELAAGHSSYQDKLYKNDGRGIFTIDANALPDTKASGSCVTAADFDRDGDLDLFVGGRLVPAQYPLPAQSCLLRNNGQGRFTNVTPQLAPDLQKIGLVTAALWTDTDLDGRLDLLLAGEWMPLTYFKNTGKKFVNNTKAAGLSHTSGWWNSLNAGDFDKDGDVDYVAGNLGLNSKYKASQEEPVMVYAADYDKNGSVDPLLFYYVQGKQVPTHSRDVLYDQIVGMRRRFPTYTQYAEAGLKEVLSPEEIQEAYQVKSEYFKTSYLENVGNGKLVVKPLPMLAQFAPVCGVLTDDYNQDGHLDILLTGNNYASEVQAGWYDAFIGLYLQGNGKGRFKPVAASKSGFLVTGDAKGLAQLTSKTGRPYIISGSNNDSIQIFTPTAPFSVKTIRLQPQDAYAIITDARNQKYRQEFYYGTSYLSQSSRVMSIPDRTKSIIIYDYQGRQRRVNLTNESLASKK